MSSTRRRLNDEFAICRRTETNVEHVSKSFGNSSCQPSRHRGYPSAKGCGRRVIYGGKGAKHFQNRLKDRKGICHGRDGVAGGPCRDGGVFGPADADHGCLLDRLATMGVGAAEAAIWTLLSVLCDRHRMMPRGLPAAFFDRCASGPASSNLILGPGS
jgi:hypothetical protein